MCGSDVDPNVRYEGVAQMRGQLREQLGKPPARWTMPFQLVLAECCGSRDDSLSWNLSRAKQCDAIQVDSMDQRKVQIKLKDGVSSSEEHADGMDA